MKHMHHVEADKASSTPCLQSQAKHNLHVPTVNCW